MNAEETREYWEDRWCREGTSTVGHVGDSGQEFKKQTALYGQALVKTLGLSRVERLLDFGCGWGRMFNYLSPLCSEYVGVDLSPTAIKLARKHHPYSDFRVIDPVTLRESFREEQFDVIVCCTVLQHIVCNATLVRTATKLESILVPGGRILLLENISNLPDKRHITYRFVSAYVLLFSPAIEWDWKETVEHRGERHAVFLGVKG